VRRLAASVEPFESDESRFHDRENLARHSHVHQPFAALDILGGFDEDSSGRRKLDLARSIDATERVVGEAILLPANTT